MNFDFSEDQHYLRDEARRFLTDACPAAAVRRVMDDKAIPFDTDLWRRVAAQGWFGVTIAEEHGGLGLDVVDLCAIVEEIGASLAPLPFGSTLYLLAEAVSRFGSISQKATLLPKIARGEAIGCGALFDGDMSALVRDGRVTGFKRPVVDGGIADVAVLSGLDERGPALFLAQLDSPTVKRVTLEPIDGSLNVVELTFTDTPVERLAHSNAGSRAELLARAAVFYAFEQVGGADRCLTLTCDYVKTREAFGGPIGRFQAVKHKLADIFTANEIARSHAYHAAWAAESAPAMLTQAASAARVAASEAFWQASKEMIHLHGAIGFTWEHDAHLFYRRAHHLSLNLGAPQVWKDQLYNALTDPV